MTTYHKVGQGGACMVSKVLLIGGDIIQYYMAKSLIEKGFAIFYYDLHFPKELIGAKKIQQKQDLCNLMRCKDCVIFCAEIGNADHMAEELNHRLLYDEPADRSCLIWKPDGDIRFLLREAVAEAAIVEAKLLSRKTVSGSSALVLGFDVYAEEIASLLRRWDAKVVVVPEDDMEQKLAQYRGYDKCDRNELAAFLEGNGQKLGESLDFVFQCSSQIPLRAKQICCLSPDTILLNMTQDEKALDAEYARSLMLQAKHCKNLLSEYAPAVAGRLLAEKLWEDLQKKAS